MLISQITTKLHPCSVDRIIKLDYQIVIKTIYMNCKQGHVAYTAVIPLFWHEGIENICEENTP